MGIFKAATIYATRTVWPLLRSRPGLFLGLQFLSFALQQFARLGEEYFITQGAENIGMLVAFASLSVALEMAWYCAFFSLTVRATHDLTNAIRTPVAQTLACAINPLLIENLRVLARVIFWLPFFLLPAFYHYLRLSLVSLVVLEDERYARGELEALARSRQLSRDHVPLILISLLLVLGLEPLVSTLLTGGETAVWRNPLGAAFSVPLSLVLDAWVTVFLLAVYRGLVKLKPEPSPQAPAPVTA